MEAPSPVTYSRRDFMRVAGIAPFGQLRSAAPVTRRVDGLQLGLPTWVFTSNTTIPRARAVVVSTATMPVLRTLVPAAAARGWDVTRFVREHADKIDFLYLKDRRWDYTSVPFGEGDTPIREVVQLIRERQYPIRCYVDCEYPSSDRAQDIRQSIEYLNGSR